MKFNHILGWVACKSTSPATLSKCDKLGNLIGIAPGIPSPAHPIWLM
ncbi:MAG: hypothetical protein PHS47_01465 [Methanocellales archaeon]|nr:hypothetical protein [Methanocellales archaeon]